MDKNISNVTLKVEQAKSGYILRKDVYSRNGKVLLLKKNHVLSDEDFKLLSKNKITELVIDFSSNISEYEKITLDCDVNSTINQELVDCAIDAIKGNSFTAIKNVSSKIVEALAKDSKFSYSLSDYKKRDEFYKKTVRIAAFAGKVAAGFSRDIAVMDANASTLDPVSVVEAALLCGIGEACSNTKELKRIDISKLEVPDKCKVYKKDFASFDAKKLPLYSYALLANDVMGKVTENVKFMVLFSHEQNNGEGPLGVSSEVMNAKKRSVFGAKIINACRIYDELLKKAIMKDDDLNTIYENLNQKVNEGIIDPVMVRYILSEIPLFSKGNKVLLSDGRYAVVEKTTKDITAPVVKVITNSEVINLSLSNFLVVSQIVGSDVKFYDMLTTSSSSAIPNEDFFKL